MRIESFNVRVRRSKIPPLEATTSRKQHYDLHEALVRCLGLFCCRPWGWKARLQHLLSEGPASQRPATTSAVGRPGLTEAGYNICCRKARLQHLL
jgi:hypothetical protein